MLIGPQSTHTQCFKYASAVLDNSAGMSQHYAALCHAVPEPQRVFVRQGVGKSCLVLRYVRGQFDPSSKVTVGAAFMSHSVHLPDGTTVKFEIW